jgi:leucyl-tRNA synthetase
MPVNWCPKCKVVCANEEVIDTRHERCGTVVERRNMSQWVLKITEYADRLDDDLDQVNFPDSVKALQRNWIGRKVWYDIEYKVEGSDEVIRVSTTRPDTQFGASFVVIAPEHEIVKGLIDIMPNERRGAVQEYISSAIKRGELARLSESKEKTGVFTGIYCINSITGARLPVYLADFALTTVGTGMVVGVPAHDERDFEFAMKFGLPVKRVIEGPGGDRSEIDAVEKVYSGDGNVFNSGFWTGLAVVMRE